MKQDSDPERDFQLARNVYLAAMSVMKYTLNMEERKYEEGRKDERYKFYKQELMKKTYLELRRLFELLDEQGLIQRVDYDEDLKYGYKDTESGGSGYVNSADLDSLLR